MALPRDLPCLLEGIDEIRGDVGAQVHRERPRRRHRQDGADRANCQELDEAHVPVCGLVSFLDIFLWLGASADRLHGLRTYSSLPR
jgi:hypothetical protein